MYWHVTILFEHRTLILITIVVINNKNIMFMIILKNKIHINLNFKDMYNLTHSPNE